MNVKHHLSFHETELEKVDTETESEREKNEALHEERYVLYYLCSTMLRLFFSLKQIKTAKEHVSQQQQRTAENQERALQALGVNIDLMKRQNQEFLEELHKKLEARVTFYVQMWNLRRRVEVSFLCSSLISCLSIYLYLSVTRN